MSQAQVGLYDSISEGDAALVGLFWRPTESSDQSEPNEGRGVDVVIQVGMRLPGLTAPALGQSPEDDGRPLLGVGSRFTDPLHVSCAPTLQVEGEIRVGLDIGLPIAFEPGTIRQVIVTVELVKVDLDP